MTTKLNLRRWDAADYLKTDEDIRLFLEACFEEAGDDANFIAKALGTIARARGMTQLAQQIGVGRESLYKSLSGDANPSFETILKVVNAFGLQLRPLVKKLPVVKRKPVARDSVARVSAGSDLLTRDSATGKFVSKSPGKIWKGDRRVDDELLSVTPAESKKRRA
jgi:probable addiction module antidote protein